MDGQHQEYGNGSEHNLPHQEQQSGGLNQNYSNTEQRHEDPDLEDIAGKIFIGGLSWQTTEATLRYYFEKYGELSDVALMVDKRTGKPRLLCQ